MMLDSDCLVCKELFLSSFQEAFAKLEVSYAQNRMVRFNSKP